jgi:hypothetical protein
MSGFSNTDTGNKPADPYKEKNLDDASIKEKVEDLSGFVSACKFGMMTTRDGSTGRLVSRCMALAAKVCPSKKAASPSWDFQKCSRVVVNPRLNRKSTA